ncbi:MAG: VWA domain-containing protein, partial [Gemmatimonadales bacterium]|nr:VWA domain-containing protein [Gemmatimonadales bacterium]
MAEFGEEGAAALAPVDDAATIGKTAKTDGRRRKEMMGQVIKVKQLCRGGTRKDVLVLLDISESMTWLAVGVLYDLLKTLFDAIKARKFNIRLGFFGPQIPLEAMDDLDKFLEMVQMEMHEIFAWGTYFKPCGPAAIAKWKGSSAAMVVVTDGALAAEYGVTQQKALKFFVDTIAESGVPCLWNIIPHIDSPRNLAQASQLPANLQEVVLTKSATLFDAVVTPHADATVRGRIRETVSAMLAVPVPTNSAGRSTILGRLAFNVEEIAKCAIPLDQVFRELCETKDIDQEDLLELSRVLLVTLNSMGDNVKRLAEETPWFRTIHRALLQVCPPHANGWRKFCETNPVFKEELLRAEAKRIFEKRQRELAALRCCTFRFAEGAPHLSAIDKGARSGHFGDLRVLFNHCTIRMTSAMVPRKVVASVAMAFADQERTLCDWKAVGLVAALLEIAVNADEFRDVLLDTLRAFGPVLLKALFEQKIDPVAFTMPSEIRTTFHYCSQTCPPEVRQWAGRFERINSARHLVNLTAGMTYKVPLEGGALTDRNFRQNFVHFCTMKPPPGDRHPDFQSIVGMIASLPPRAAQDGIDGRAGKVFFVYFEQPTLLPHKDACSLTEFKFFSGVERYLWSVPVSDETSRLASIAKRAGPFWEKRMTAEFEPGLVAVQE